MIQSFWFIHDFGHPKIDNREMQPSYLFFSKIKHNYKMQI